MEEEIIISKHNYCTGTTKRYRLACAKVAQAQIFLMTRLDIISEQCIRNDEDVMAVNNENKKVA